LIESIGFGAPKRNGKLSNMKIENSKRTESDFSFKLFFDIRKSNPKMGKNNKVCVFKQREIPNMMAVG